MRSIEQPILLYIILGIIFWFIFKIGIEYKIDQEVKEKLIICNNIILEDGWHYNFESNLFIKDKEEIDAKNCKKIEI